MTRLGAILKMYCAAQKRSARTCASEMGLPTSTLRRVQNGRGEISVSTFLKILVWLLQDAPPT